MTNSQSSLRQFGRAARAAISDEQKAIASDVIAEKVITSSWFQRAAHVACYLPADDEVNTWEIISRAWRQKKRVFAPVLKKNRRMQFVEITPNSDLRLNRFGIYEPIDGAIVTARVLDIVLTPVVAIDNDRRRIGMGGGYFDRTFSFLRHRQNWLHPKLVGLAFACQKVEKITPNPWDIRLFCTITEEN